MENDTILKRIFYSLGRHIKVLAIAAACSTVVYGTMYMVMYFTGRI